MSRLSFFHKIVLRMAQPARQRGKRKKKKEEDGPRSLTSYALPERGEKPLGDQSGQEREKSDG